MQFCRRHVVVVIVIVVVSTKSPNLENNNNNKRVVTQSLISWTCVTVMVIQALPIHIALIGSVLTLSASQFCGSLSRCSQHYDKECPVDESSYLYDNCRTTQSSCSQRIGPAEMLSVNCYNTCIIGNPIPLQCCADSVLAPETISLTTEPEFLIARLFSPNSPGAYPSNRFCKYNIQCPNANYNLHYNMVRFNIEPPEAKTDQCLDFLRYHFTKTGRNVPSDACGNLNDVSDDLKFGDHPPGLEVDFRSNRINLQNGVEFYLVITCTLPSATAATQTSNGSDGAKQCTPSQSLRQIVGDYPNIKNPAQQYLSRELKQLKRVKFSFSLRRNVITITRDGELDYKDNTITVVYKGKVRYRFRNIRLLQVYNRIEGCLRFRGRASPRGRQFPGHGFLQVRRRVVRYIQTIVDPKFMLTTKEERIVSQLYLELFNRQRFGNRMGPYINGPHPGENQRVNCSINTLAKLNVQSCTAVVRAAATFFLKMDTFQEYCNHKG